MKTAEEFLTSKMGKLQNTEIAVNDNLLADWIKEYAQERTKDMYPKEFLLWIGKNEYFYDIKIEKWVCIDDDGVVETKTLDELHQYWKENIFKPDECHC